MRKICLFVLLTILFVPITMKAIDKDTTLFLVNPSEVDSDNNGVIDDNDINEEIDENINNDDYTMYIITGISGLIVGAVSMYLFNKKMNIE